MSERELIHPDFAFSVAEIAAAWIIHGVSLDESKLLASSMARVFRTGQSSEDDGWTRGAPSFVGGFEATLHLAADIHSDGALLSAQAREQWLAGWPVRTAPDEIEPVLERLGALGPSWAARRAQFLELLRRNLAAS